MAVARRARLLVPVCVTALKLWPKSGEQSMLDRLSENWTEWGLGPEPDWLAWLLLTGGSSSLNKAAGLVFADSSPRPQLIVKLPRRPESAVSLAREAAALRAVHAGRPGGMAGVPQVVFFQDEPEATALGETVLTGQPIYLGLRRENYRELALRVTDWLAGLARPASPSPRDEWWPRLAEPALAEFEDSFGAALEPGHLRRARALLATLGPLPPVPEQRDCSPWNVLLSPAGELIVLDWESAEPRGLPALDLVYFLAFLAFFLDGAMETRRFGEPIRAALDPASFTGRVQAECQARYAAALGLDPAALRPLRLLAWLIHSRSEYRQLRAEAGGPPSAQVLRGSLFVQLWQAELEHGA
jgi:Phosphotransferase enzyme family